MNETLNMKNLLYIICFPVLIAQTATGQQWFDARSLGMAGSNGAITEGVEHIGGNPATLAVPTDFGFELHLLSAHLMISNNSYSLKEYDRYFTSGDSLSAADIDKLMGYIPESGLRADFLFGLKTFSFYARPFSLSLTGMGSGFLNLPKDPLQMPFYGNKDIKEYRLDDLDGEFWGAGAFNFSIGFPLIQLSTWLEENFDFFSAGISAKYLAGFQYAKINTSTGRLLTTDTNIVADGHLESIRSEGGSGLGIDVGFLANYQKQWTFSLSFNNLLGGINWNKNNELMLYEFQIDSFNFNTKDTLVSEETDTSYSTGDFHTPLPRSVTLAAAYEYWPNLIFTAAWRQGLNSSLDNTTTPLVALGTEYSPVPVVPLRAGFAVGGKNGFAVGLGFGIDLKYWQLNFGYLNHNFRWFRSARSIELAVSTQFRF